MKQTTRRVAGWILRLAVLALIGWWLSRGDTWSQLTAALDRLPLANLLGALGCGLVISTFAGVRWRLVMNAFGAEPRPPVHLLVRGYVVGQFYNLFVPGGIGGEVVRGVITRKYFGTVGTGVMVAFLDRIIGLGSLMAVFTVGLLLGPDLPHLEEYGVYLYAVGGVATALVVCTVLAGYFRRRLEGLPVIGALIRLGSRLVARVEDRFDQKLHLSALATPWPLVAAFALSAAMHGMAISVFALIGAGLDLGLDAATLLAIVPLAIIASMLPIAVAGLGPREAALVVMLGPLGVAQGEALALSLCYWAVLIFIAAMGGLVQLVWGVDLPHAGEAG
ncbi:MAG: lysylphosphatidylglycerol synthase transmembrane domain-containing protein [bacterium]